MKTMIDAIYIYIEILLLTNTSFCRITRLRARSTKKARACVQTNKGWYRTRKSIDRFQSSSIEKNLFIVYIIYLLLRYSNIKYYGYFDDVNGSFSEVNGSRVMSRTNGEQSGRSRVRKIDRSLFLPRRWNFY